MKSLIEVFKVASGRRVRKGVVPKEGGGGGWLGDSGLQSHSLFVAMASSEVVYRPDARRGSGAPSFGFGQNCEQQSGVCRQMVSGRSREDIAGVK